MPNHLKINIVDPKQYVSEGILPRGTICIGDLSGGLFGKVSPGHALVYDRKDPETSFHLVMESIGVIDEAGKDVVIDGRESRPYYEDFFTRKGIAGFQITDHRLNEKFIENLKKTKINFSILKVVGNMLRSAFSTERSREEQVSERIAKYYYRNNFSSEEGEDVSRMFCSQFVCQSLQTALAEDIIGSEKLSIEDGQSFSSWRAFNIEKIRRAVKEFPPELKRVASSMTPNNLIKSLTAIAQRSTEDERMESSLSTMDESDVLHAGKSDSVRKPEDVKRSVDRKKVFTPQELLRRKKA